MFSKLPDKMRQMHYARIILAVVSGYVGLAVCFLLPRHQQAAKPVEVVQRQPAEPA